MLSGSAWGVIERGAPLSPSLPGGLLRSRSNFGLGSGLIVITVRECAPEGTAEGLARVVETGRPRVGLATNGPPAEDAVAATVLVNDFPGGSEGDFGLAFSPMIPFGLAGTEATSRLSAVAAAGLGAIVPRDRAVGKFAGAGPAATPVPTVAEPASPRGTGVGAVTASAGRSASTIDWLGRPDTSTTPMPDREAISPLADKPGSPALADTSSPSLTGVLAAGTARGTAATSGDAGARGVSPLPGEPIVGAAILGGWSVCATGWAGSPDEPTVPIGNGDGIWLFPAGTEGCDSIDGSLALIAGPSPSGPTLMTATAPNAVVTKSKGRARERAVRDTTLRAGVACGPDPA